MDREGWKRAFNHVKQIKVEAAKNGTENKCFPPSSIDFVTYAKPPMKMHQIIDSSKYLDAKALPKSENAKRMSSLLAAFNKN